MAKFPVESDDNVGVIDALNYLLSGPAGLGQNFAGFSSYTPAYLTGNYRVPFAQAGVANLYVTPISLGVATMVDERTWKFFFSSAQPSPPFALGNIVTIAGVTDSYYDGTYSPIGVAECTTTYVILRTSESYAIVPDSSGGTASLDLTGLLNSTDANARVVVSGGTDRVFISAQLDQQVHYTVPSGTYDLVVSVQVNRYIGFINNDPINPDYIFNYDETVAKKDYTYSSLSGTGVLSLTESVFASILDRPKPGYYWYILEVQFNSTGGSVNVTQDELFLRSLSAQVVKQ